MNETMTSTRLFALAIFREKAANLTLYHFLAKSEGDAVDQAEAYLKQLNPSSNPEIVCVSLRHVVYGRYGEVDGFAPIVNTTIAEWKPGFERTF